MAGHLRIASEADAAPVDEHLLAAWKEIGGLIESGEVTSFVCLVDGPQFRDAMLGGQPDGHAMLGFAVARMVTLVQDASE